MNNVGKVEQRAGLVQQEINIFKVTQQEIDNEVQIMEQRVERLELDIEELEDKLPIAPVLINGTFNSLGTKGCNQLKKPNFHNFLQLIFRKEAKLDIQARQRTF